MGNVISLPVKRHICIQYITYYSKMYICKEQKGYLNCQQIKALAASLPFVMARDTLHLYQILILDQ